MCRPCAGRVLTARCPRADQVAEYDAGDPELSTRMAEADFTKAWRIQVQAVLSAEAKEPGVLDRVLALYRPSVKDFPQAVSSLLAVPAVPAAAAVPAVGFLRGSSCRGCRARCGFTTAQARWQGGAAACGQNGKRSGLIRAVVRVWLVPSQELLTAFARQCSADLNTTDAVALAVPMVFWCVCQHARPQHTT